MVLIDRALCLPAVDVAALLSGQSIAAIPNVFVQTGWTFALYPYADTAKSHRLNSQPTSSTTIQAWAKCEQCLIIEDASQIELLSHLTIWSKDTLKDVLDHKQHLFLTLLRVYHFPEPLEIIPELAPEKLGKFVNFSSSTISNAFPVLSDRTFAQRKHKLENLEPPDHPELEALHDTIAQLTHPAAIHLEQDLKYFLGWAESAIVDRSRANSAWIQEITQAGNSSEGDRFEKLVRKSFIELGFQNSLNNPKASLDPESSGGAAGIDIYCEAPYPLVGECKASKHEKVPNSVSAQLIHLGHTHLGKVQFDCCIKVLFVAGRLTDAAEKAAVENGMNVMRPETLERLVTLKAEYPGAINLIELKACLETAPFGELSNDKINCYLDRVQEDIEVRSRIVGLLQSKAPQELGVETIWGAYEFSNPPRSLNPEQLKDILIELSSPLTGFIGRKESDRFYFLRPLNLES